MSTTYTTSVGLPYPAQHDPLWHLPLIAALGRLDALAPVGGLAVRPSDPGDPDPLPATTRDYDVAAGSFLTAAGAVVTYAGSTGNTAGASQTTYLWLTEAGSLATGADWPASTNVMRLATITTDASTITALTDERSPFRSSGGSSGFLAKSANDTVADGVNYTFGTTTGTKLGTGTTQKLGFFNATPVAQQSNTTDLRTALINLGFVASGGANPLNLNGGALTCAAANINGTLTLADAQNIVVNTTTGTKIGTSASQKLGFFNATPIVQPSSTTDLRTALINLGLYATGGASPLNLNGGAFTCAAANISGLTTISDAQNIAVGTTTGTKFGTATTQKLGFYNATPIVQPGNTTDLRATLINLGLLASGGANPLDLNGGAFTAAAGTFTGGISAQGKVTYTGANTISSTVNVVLVNASSDFTLTLPSASAVSGRLLFVKRIDANNNTVTVSRAGSDTIDGATSNTELTGTGRKGLVLYSDGGTAWHIVGRA